MLATTTVMPSVIHFIEPLMTFELLCCDQHSLTSTAMDRRLARTTSLDIQVTQFLVGLGQ